MNHAEIVSCLSNLTDPSTAIFNITIYDVMNAIACRMEEDSLSLSVEDLELAREEVTAAICHHLDIREYIDMGLDAWEVSRKL
jgi:hypothetical protein